MVPEAKWGRVAGVYIKLFWPKFYKFIITCLFVCHHLTDYNIFLRVIYLRINARSQCAITWIHLSYSSNSHRYKRYIQCLIRNLNWFIMLHFYQYMIVGVKLRVANIFFKFKIYICAWFSDSGSSSRVLFTSESV